MASFGFFLEELKIGRAGTRASWPAELKMCITRIKPADSFLSAPFFCMTIGGTHKHVWFPSMDDMFAEDWDTFRPSRLVLPQ